MAIFLFREWAIQAGLVAVFIYLNNIKLGPALILDTWPDGSVLILPLEIYLR
jgi:hypothetical protein